MDSNTLVFLVILTTAIFWVLKKVLYEKIFRDP